MTQTEREIQHGGVAAAQATRGPPSVSLSCSR